MTELDLNIDNYNITELFQLFKIDESYSENSIIQKIDHFIKTIKRENYTVFLKNAESKLIQHININNPNPNHKPSNYDIIYNKSTTSGGEHYVTKDKVIPIKNVYDYKFPVGVINPIEKRTITQIVCLDTLFRHNYDKTNASNFTWILPFILNNVISMKMTSLQLPYQWHMFSNIRKSNQFMIYLFNMKKYPDSIHKIIIPDGNYISNTFENTINNYFTNIGQGLQYLKLNINTVSSKTCIYVKTADNDSLNEDINSEEDNNCYPYDPNSSDYSPDFYFIIDFKIDIENNRSLYKNAGWMMGFRKEKYIVTKNNKYVNNTSSIPSVIYQGFLESESSYGSSIWKYIFIEIDDFNNNFVTNSIISPLNESSYIGNNIMARIAVPCGQYSIINDNSSDLVFKTREYFGPVTIKKLNIKLLNKFGDIIDLLNNDYSFALEIKILYN